MSSQRSALTSSFTKAMFFPGCHLPLLLLWGLFAYLSPRLEDLAFCNFKSLALGLSSSETLGFE